MSYQANKLGDPNNLGFFATSAALAAAYPVGAPGYFALVGDTDSFWVWDTGTGQWIDSKASGTTAYVYIAYASDSSGTGFTMTFNPALDYIAIKNTTVAIPSPSASDFTGLWKNYAGIDGTSFTWKGTYSGATAYTPNDAVYYLGSSYMCKLASTGNLPTNTTYWDVMAQKGADGAGSGDVVGPSSATDNAIARFDTTTGKLIQNSTAILEDSGTISVNTIKLSATPTVGSPIVGELYINAAENGLPQIRINANSSLTIGAEMYAQVVNKSGSSIGDGIVVYVNSAQGNRPTIALAQANNLATCRIIGMTTSVIADNAEGFVTIIGDVNGFNTSGFTAGDTLYLSATVAGAVTNVSPASPNYRVIVGKALNSTVNGLVSVRPDQPIALNTALGTDDVAPSQNAVKVYTDAKVADSITDGVTTIAPSQNAVFDALSLKASLSGATFTGKVSSPNFVEGYTTTATAAGNTILTVSSTFLQYFTGSTTQTVTLPDVTTLTLGHQFSVVNNSTGAVTINSSGANAVVVLAAGTSALITCILITGTTAASWSSIYTNVTATSGTKYTMPSTSATIARTDAAQTFTGVQTFSSGPVFNALPTGTGVSSASTASTLVARDANKNIAINNSVSDYTTTATAAGSTTLTVASTYQQYFTGSTTQTLVLPVATTLVNGIGWNIVNNSTGAVTVNTSGGNTLLVLAGGTSAYVTCINTAGGTGTASWSYSYLGDAYASGKKITINNTLTFAGTDGTTMTFPSTSSTVLTAAQGTAVAAAGITSATTTVNTSAATAPTSGQVLTATSSTTATWQTPSAGGASFWTDLPGATRTSNTTFTVTGDLTAKLAKGVIVKWTESSVVRVGMISIPSTFSTTTTVTIIGDTMASIDASSCKYALIGAEMFTSKFAIAGTIGSAGTDVSNAYYATEPMRVIGADLQVGTAGTTGSTTVDINKGGTTMFTTKPNLATTVAASPTPFTADTATSLALNDKVTIDIDGIQSTPAVDMYIQLYLWPTRYNNL